MDPATQMQEMLLAQLRDIRLPEAINWWPPAPGWWIVAAVVVAILMIGIYTARRHRLANRYRREAKAELASMYARWNDNQKTDEYLIRAGSILRQIAVHVCGRQAVSSATGDQWMNALAGISKRPVPESLRIALTQSAYQPKPRFNIDQAHQDIIDWLDGVSQKQYFASRKSGSASPHSRARHEEGVHV